MVRIKHRYLLGTILYPGSGVSASGTAKSGSELEFLAFNQPTTDDLTASKLQKAIQDEVFSLFGEYGAGAVKASLQGTHLSTFPPISHCNVSANGWNEKLKIMAHSEISFSGNIDVYIKDFKRSL